jgi:hypothetical protein
MTDAKAAPNAGEARSAARPVAAWMPVVFGAMAAGMGWGIRGQYGHETGAMVAGLLFAAVMAALFLPGATTLAAARAVGFCAVAVGIGGSMTYGQTVGLTHDAALVGNDAAWAWGMVGLAVKGGIWIGFGGLFLGMGLGGVRHRASDICLLFGVGLAVFFLGVGALNEPFDPASKELPWLYFSDSWRWEPGADLKPRREVWGGLLFALVWMVWQVGWMRRDGVAVRLCLWGVAGGAVGFPLGQSIQSWHAWNLELFRAGEFAGMDRLVNWWNMMETVFGATWGAALGHGVWRERERIRPTPEQSGERWLKLIETPLLLLHAALMMTGEFLSVPAVDPYVDFSLLLAWIPLLLVAGGRLGPLLVTLPLVLLPIAGKTVRRMAYETPTIDPAMGWILLLAIPMAIAFAIALRHSNRRGMEAENSPFTRQLLIFAAWVYFGLNFAFFDFPWPWQPWTARTPNAMIYTCCLLGLSWLAWRLPGLRRRAAGAAERPPA